MESVIGASNRLAELRSSLPVAPSSKISKPHRCQLKKLFRVVIERFKKFGRRSTSHRQRQTNPGQKTSDHRRFTSTSHSTSDRRKLWFRRSTQSHLLLMRPSKRKPCAHIYTFRDRDDAEVVEAYDGCEQVRVSVRRNSTAGVAGEPRIVYPKRVIGGRSSAASIQSSISKDSAVITSFIIGSRDLVDGRCRKDRERGGAVHSRVSCDDDVDEKTTIDSQNPSSPSMTSDPPLMQSLSILSSRGSGQDIDDVQSAGSNDDSIMVQRPSSSNNSSVSETLSIMSNAFADVSSGISDLSNNGSTPAAAAAAAAAAAGGRGTANAIIGIGTNSELDVHLSEASNKLQFYYQNNFDKKHHECHDKLKALIDVLNQVLKKMRDLCKVSDVTNVDESVARRLLAAQRELIVLEDIVWKIRDAAQRHGYSCGVKESLDDMAITLYCLRQMHRRQDVLIQEIILARHQNIELMKIIEAFRVATQNVPIVRMTSMNNAADHHQAEDNREPYTVTPLDEPPSIQQEPLPPNQSSPDSAVNSDHLIDFTSAPEINLEVRAEDGHPASEFSSLLIKPTSDNSEPSSTGFRSLLTTSHQNQRQSSLTEWFYSCTVRVHCSTSVTLSLMAIGFLSALILATLIGLPQEPVNDRHMAGCPSSMSWWNLPNFFELIGLRSSRNGQPPPT